MPCFRSCWLLQAAVIVLVCICQGGWAKRASIGGQRGRDQSDPARPTSIAYVICCRHDDRTTIKPSHRHDHRVHHHQHHCTIVLSPPLSFIGIVRAPSADLSSQLAMETYFKAMARVLDAITSVWPYETPNKSSIPKPIHSPHPSSSMHGP